MTFADVEELLASAPPLFLQAVQDVDKCTLWGRHVHSTDMTHFRDWVTAHKDALRTLYHTQQYVQDPRRATAGCALLFFGIDC